MPDLTLKQKRFADNILAGSFNSKTAAARDAGYAQGSAGSTAILTLKLPHVVEYMESVRNGDKHVEDAFQSDKASIEDIKKEYEATRLQLAQLKLERERAETETAIDAEMSRKDWDLQMESAYRKGVAMTVQAGEVAALNMAGGIAMSIERELLEVE